MIEIILAKDGKQWVQFMVHENHPSPATHLVCQIFNLVRDNDLAGITIQYRSTVRVVGPIPDEIDSP